MSGTPALRVLRERIARIDAADRPWATSPGVAGLLEHAVAVLADSAGDPAEQPARSADPLDPATAEEATDRCRLLAAVAMRRPDLVGGPLRPDAQQWVGTARHHPPTPARLRPPTATTSTAGKPFRTGLFTSTAGPDGRTSWDLYLQPYRGSDLYPLPWAVWRLPVQPDARVREIARASDWTNLIGHYPARPASGTRTGPPWPPTMPPSTWPCARWWQSRAGPCTARPAPPPRCTGTPRAPCGCAGASPSRCC